MENFPDEEALLETKQGLLTMAFLRFLKKNYRELRLNKRPLLGKYPTT